MNINKMVNGTLSGQIAQKLDAADGKKDGKISAFVWNEFVKDKGGKEIQSYISVENALKSITTYAVRDSKKSEEGKSINELAKNWLANLVGKAKDVPQADTPNKLPAADNNPPTVDATEAKTIQETKPDKSKAAKTITNQDGTSTKYDKNGYIWVKYDQNGKETRMIYRVQTVK